ncbi:MAG TPA: DUF5666 domain-containing protein [Gammaproteobacteria bacterium]
MSWLHLRRIRARIAGVIACLTLAGCGIDQGGVTSPTPGPATSSSSGLLVVGPITGFGSVLVNGIALQTAAADVLVDGNPVAESVLREGQIIRAVAAVTSTSINAVTIEYRASVRGPIQARRIDGAAVILGQLVITNERTVFDIGGGNSLNDIALFANVEVSGFRLPSGELLATWVGLAELTDSFTMAATITSVDAAGLTFDLDGLTVDFSEPLLLDVPAGVPDTGIVVEVRGTRLNDQGELVASEIRALPGRPGDVVVADTTEDAFAPARATDTGTRRANVFGVVTAIGLPASISIGDVTVAIDTLTQIGNGDLGFIGIGQLVRVEGDVTNTGIIQADRIELL